MLISHANSLNWVNIINWVTVHETERALLFWKHNRVLTDQSVLTKSGQRKLTRQTGDTLMRIHRILFMSIRQQPMTKRIWNERENYVNETLPKKCWVKHPSYTTNVARKGSGTSVKITSGIGDRRCFLRGSRVDYRRLILTQYLEKKRDCFAVYV